jgi:hypothetical protein
MIRPTLGLDDVSDVTILCPIADNDMLIAVNVSMNPPYKLQGALRPFKRRYYPEEMVLMVFLDLSVVERGVGGLYQLGVLFLASIIFWYFSLSGFHELRKSIIIHTLLKG